MHKFTLENAKCQWPQSILLCLKGKKKNIFFDHGTLSKKHNNYACYETASSLSWCQVCVWLLALWMKQDNVQQINVLFKVSFCKAKPQLSDAVSNSGVLILQYGKQQTTMYVSRGSCYCSNQTVTNKQAGGRWSCSTAVTRGREVTQQTLATMHGRSAPTSQLWMGANISQLQVFMKQFLQFMYPTYICLIKYFAKG